MVTVKNKLATYLSNVTHVTKRLSLIHWQAIRVISDDVHDLMETYCTRATHIDDWQGAVMEQLIEEAGYGTGYGI